MQDPESPVRAQIEAGLALGKPIIPVLLTGAIMPAPDQLPPSIREFALLNAAWVRDGVDFPGDMRRLTRVIERVTRLRKAQRWTESGLLLEGGALLTALILIAADALATRYVVGQYATITQGALLLTGAALVAIELVVAGVAGGLVTRQSGRRANGALAALLGAGLAMLAAAAALHAASGDYGASASVFATSLTSLNAIPTAGFDSIGLFLVLRIPFQLLGVPAAGALGAIYGRIAYRTRARAIQERLLYGMARAASGGALIEVSARAARITGAPATIAPVPAVAVAEIAQPTVGAPGESAIQAEAPAQPAGSALLPVSEADPEVTRRESLLTDIRAARLATRNRTRVRLGAIAGVAAAVLLTLSVIGTQIFNTQILGVDAAAASSAATAEAHVQQTRTVELAPFFTLMPGPGCDAGSSARATWSYSDPEDSAPSCGDNYTTFTAASTRGQHTMALELSISSSPYTSRYELAADVKLGTPSTCAGLITNGSSASFGSGVTFEVCAPGVCHSVALGGCTNGIWRVVYSQGISYDIVPDFSDISSRTLASGHVHLSKTNHLEVTIAPNSSVFLINGKVVASRVDTRFVTPTQFVGLCLDWGNSNYGFSSADFTKFTYSPLGL